MNIYHRFKWIDSGCHTDSYALLGFRFTLDGSRNFMQIQLYPFQCVWAVTLSQATLVEMLSY